MTQKFLVVAAAVAAVSLAAAAPAAADCYSGHTVASKEASPTVSVQPPATLTAPKPAEGSTLEATTTTPDVRTAEVKPAAR